MKTIAPLSILRAAQLVLAATVVASAGMGCSSPANSTSTTTDAAATSDLGGADQAAGDAAAGKDAAADGGADTLIPGGSAADSAGTDASTAETAGTDASATDAAQDTAGAVPVPIEQIADKFLDAICTAMTSCGAKTFATKQGCMAFLSAQIGGDGDGGPGAMVELVKAGKATYDAAAAGKCLALYSNCTMFKSNKAPGECAKVFTGVAADGAICNQDEECKSLYCAKSETQNWDCPGKCTAKVAVGQACSSDDACQGDLLCIESKCTAAGGKVGDACVTGSCGAGLFCDSNAVKSACAAKVNAGQPCDSEDACTAGLFCGPNSAGDASVCQAPAKIGAPCASSGSGSGGGSGSDMFGNAPSPCEGGGICAAAATPGGASTCLAPAALGGACTHPQQCGGMDVECAGLTATTPGKCQLLPGKGQKCSQPDLMKGVIFTCQLPLACDSKTSVCVDPPTAGQPCLFMCAQGLSCSDGICQGKAKEGESCESADCIKGTMCENAKCVKVICQ